MNTYIDSKILPHSIEAEQSILGGLMIDSSAWEKINEIINENDFYNSDHRNIFNAISQLANSFQPIDILTVIEKLKKFNKINESFEEIYIFNLAKNTPSIANIVAYAQIIKNDSFLRKLILISQEIAESAFNPNGKDILQLLDDAEQKIFKISENTYNFNTPTDIKNLLTKAIEKIDTLYHSKSSITGLSTGFTDLDAITAGLQPSDLIIVAGRPSMGKTSFAMNIAENAALKSNKPILIFSMEMPASALSMRMISSFGRIDQHRLKIGKLDEEDWPRITQAVSILSGIKLFIDDSSALSPSDIRSRARKFYREHGELGLIVIDYLQLMSVPGFTQNRTGEISEISRSLKGLARELNVPIIALSQLNRSLEQRSDRRPIMSDLRDSGAIEQDADVIMFVYRDEVYYENSPAKGVAEIIIAKHRNGAIGKVNLTFLGKYTKFENYLDINHVPKYRP